LSNLFLRASKKKEEVEEVEVEEVQRKPKKMKENMVVEEEEMLPKPKCNLSEEDCSDTKKRSRREKEVSNESDEDNHRPRKRFIITKPL
jgi:hypothetical protein